MLCHFYCKLVYIEHIFYCRTCQSLGRHCPRLQRLDLESCNAITDTSLIAIGYVQLRLL